MKRILLSLFVAIIGLGAVAEDDVTGNARSMRTQIVNYIRNEGYNPSVDDDGDIMFRYEGDNYYIQCQNYGDEVYVRTFSDMSTDESPSTVCDVPPTSARTNTNSCACWFSTVSSARNASCRSTRSRNTSVVSGPTSPLSRRWRMKSRTITTIH